MDLARVIAQAVAERRDLRFVPLPVIEASIREGIDRLTEIVPAGTDATELDSIAFESCEGCDQLVDPSRPDGAEQDGQGAWWCQACQVEEGRAP